MKNLLLTVLTAAAISSTAAAADNNLDVFSQTFTSADQSLAPFTSWASPYEPTDAFKDWFDSDWSLLTFNNGDVYAASCSTFGNLTYKADAGLVTPKIKLPAEGGLLQFLAFNWNPQLTGTNNRMSVYISTTGNQKEDFTTENLLKTYNVKAYSSTQGVTFNNYEINLEKYAGKEVYLAFVNNGINAGGLCLNNFKISKYIGEVSAKVPSLVTTEEPIVFYAKTSLRTPISCKGFTANLYINDELVSTYSNPTQLNGSTTAFSFNFPDKLNPKMGNVYKWRIDVTPNYEGAEAISTSGEIACSWGFPAVAVEEEFTGVYCQFCPMGAVGIEKLSADYGDRYIGIAVHAAGGYSSGVMTSPTYGTDCLYYINDRLGITGFPYAEFNRTSNTTPSNATILERDLKTVLSGYTPVKVNVEKVIYYSEDNKISVYFKPFSSIDGLSQYQACAVLLADGLKGTSELWTQQNALAGKADNTMTQFGIYSDMIDDWKPYYSTYTEGSRNWRGEYNHVAMGAWPDYLGNGCPLGVINKDGGELQCITFDVPMQNPDWASIPENEQKPSDQFGVQDITKTSVVVLILDSKTGDIVYGQKVKYADFDLAAGVDKVANPAATFRAVKGANGINVEAAQGAEVNIYTPDGRLLSSTKMAADTASIATNGFRGLVIVSVTKGTDKYFTKIIL